MREEPLSTIRLHNAVFFAHHGVHQAEQHTGGRFEVDVAMDLRVDYAALNDDLEQTVDYERVYRLVQDLVVSNRFRLLERLAYLIGQKVLTSFAVVRKVEVTVRKPNPPIGGTTSAVEAVYRATQPESLDSAASASNTAAAKAIPPRYKSRR